MNQRSLWAKEILGSNAVILDTETSGVSKADQVIQLAIIDMQGNTLFDSLFRPTCEIHPASTTIHHLTKYHLRNAPPFADVYEVVKSTLEGRTAIAYNVNFDKRMMRQTAQGFNLDALWLESLDWQCAMRAHAEFLGVKNAPKLEGGDHTAKGDCRATLDLLYRMAGPEQQPQVEPQRTQVEPVSVPAPKELVGMTGHELLALLAPPIELLDSLELLFETRRQRGQTVSDATQRWLALWQDIRSDQPSPIDNAPPAAWQAVGDVIVDSRKALAF